MSYAIRRLGPEDLSAYRTLQVEALEAAPEAFATSLEEAGPPTDSEFRALLARLVVFGAFDEYGVLGGMSAFGRRKGLKVQHVGDVVAVYVRPPLRGSDCGLALLKGVMNHARHHVIQLELGVGTDNVPAIRLDERAGFRICGTEPRALCMNGRFIDEHLMVRFLYKAPGVKQ